MAILMMVMLVGLMLGALLVPMIVTQDRTTRFVSTRVQALNAAESGIEVTLGLIRGGVTSGIGDASKLPCGTQTGAVNSSGAAAYSTVVEYFTFDPAKALYPKSTPPEAEPYPSANAMRCIAGYGTYDPTTGSTTPGYARLTSTGTVGAPVNGSTAGRTLTSTYVFRTSNVAILGGTIALLGSASPALCMDVGSASAQAGTALALQPCSATAPAAPQQVFAYRTDLTLQLVSSISPANPRGVCLNSVHTPAVNGDAVRLSQCGTLGSPPSYTQQWSFNDNGQYQAAQANSVTTGALPDLCMSIDVQSAGQPIVLRGCGSGAGWVPSPSVGPGAASVTQRAGNAAQWVNYSEYSRCIDVPNTDVSRGFLIAYPCKQNPFPGAVAWNQLFQSPAIPTGSANVTGQVATTTGGTNYCLTSSGTNGGYVSTRTCTGGASQTWTIYGGDSSLTYSTKYTVVSGTLCLGLSDTAKDLPPWSVLDVETCTGAADQKWNAVPNLLTPTLRNMHEN